MNKLHPKILIIDNFDSFTFNLADYFQQLGCDVMVHRNTLDPEKIHEIQPDAIVFSPGPSIPKNAGNMMRIIEQFHRVYPLLGVCLGHQAFVEFFGGSLKLVKPMHGVASNIEHDGKTIFEGIPQYFAAGRYHSLAAKKVPECLEISAQYEGIVMGVRHKSLPIEGVQFHPESVLTMKAGNGIKLLQNFLEKYVHVPARLTLKDFLEKSIAGELNVQQQEDFLRNHDVISPIQLAQAVMFLRNQMTTSERVAPYGAPADRYRSSVCGARKRSRGVNTVPGPAALTSVLFLNRIGIKGAIDVCGTGGSGLSRINTSTLSSFILASMGVRVAKHGNKAASGRCGSFDVLEELGINFDLPPEDIEKIYKIQNLAFLFARHFHPVLRQFSEVRQKVGVPTFFNLLGPLLNPAGPSKQIIGTAFRDQMELLAETCRLLKKKHVLIVCGEDGLDEVTLTGKTVVVELKNGKIRKYSLKPDDFGVKKAFTQEIAGGDILQNTAIAREILQGERRTRHLDLVLINAALALKFIGKAKTLKEAYKKAKQAIQTGEANETFQRMKLFSNTSSLLLKIIANKYKEVKADRKNRTSHTNSQSKDYKRAGGIVWGEYDARPRGSNLNVFFIANSYQISPKNKQVSPPRNFKDALSKKSKALIAEIKKKSPSKGNLATPKFSVIQQAQLYETAGTSAISVLCDRKFFGGSLKDMEKVKRATRHTPILCKEFILHEAQIHAAHAHGADAILLIASILTESQIRHFLEVTKKLGMAALCEVHTLEELQKVLRTPAEIIGINQRDLRDFSINTNLANELISHIPKDKIIIAESGILEKKDVDNLPNRVNAMLIGTSIMQAENPRQKIQELLGISERHIRPSKNLIIH